MNSPNKPSRKRRRASTATIADINNSDMQGNGPATGRSVPQSISRTKFVVGLDYGTTYSSVSYIKFNAANAPSTIYPEQIRSVKNWPGADEFYRNPEVPSESWYLNDEFYWGYNARQEVKGIENGQLNSRNRIIQFAKLLLLEDLQDESGPRSELRRTLHKNRKTAKDVVKDYIRELLKHSKEYLEDKEKFNDDCEVELVLCLPAGWSAKAIRIMQEILLEVAQEIKFGILAPLFILNEPEAATAYTLEAFPEENNLRKGDVFMVCDAGGGTVDTITYRVLREHPFRVQEVVTPAGSSCGSSYVNQALKREVIKRLKDTDYKALKGPFEYIIEHDMMNSFEYLKRKFNPSDGFEGTFKLVVRGLSQDPRKGFGDHLLYIPRLVHPFIEFTR